MPRLLAGALLVTLVAGCESDVDKLQRLRTEESMLDLNVDALERRWDSLYQATGEAYHPVFDTLSEKKAELDLVRAEIDRLLR